MALRTLRALCLCRTQMNVLVALRRLQMGVSVALLCRRMLLLVTKAARYGR